MTALRLPSLRTDLDVGRRPVESGSVVSENRIVALDVMRGFALLGILIVNIESFAGPESLHDVPEGLAKAAFIGWYAHLDLAIVTFKWLFVEGKMRGLFAMLFGGSAVLLTERIERVAPARSADIFLRRSMWLALFGLIHATLIWQGDILFDYGLLALLFLFPLRHVAAGKLVGIGLVIWIVAGTLGLSTLTNAGQTIRQGDRMLVAARAEAAGQPLSQKQRDILPAATEERHRRPTEIALAVRNGQRGFFASIPSRAVAFSALQVQLFTSGFFTEVLGAMMCGMGLYKLGFLSSRWPTGMYLAVAIAGYAISIPIVLIGMAHTSRLGFTEAAMDRWLALPYDTEVAFATLANAAVILILIRQGWPRPALRLLGAVGRTAFSNYILTSLICQLLFAWSPLKLYGKIEYYQYLFVVLAVWSINLTMSALWLQYFAFGPLERVWRSLTYWTRQPLRARSPTTAIL